jgi:hypothetical protein
MKGGGRNYRSILLPHLDFIRKQRENRETWESIAKDLRKIGVPITASGVGKFLQRQENIRLPIGFRRTIQKTEESRPDTFDLPAPVKGARVEKAATSTTTTPPSFTHEVDIKR